MRQRLELLGRFENLRGYRRTMVEEFTQRTALVGSAGLRSIHSVKGLVEKEANGPAQINPRRAIRIEGWIVP